MIRPEQAKFILAALSKDETRPHLMLPFVCDVPRHANEQGRVDRWLCATDGHRLHAVMVTSKVPLGTAIVDARGNLGHCEYGFQHPPAQAVWCHKSRAFKADVDMLDVLISSKHPHAMIGVGFGCGDDEDVPLKLHRANRKPSDSGFAYYQAKYVADALLAVPRARRSKVSNVEKLRFGMTADNGEPIDMAPMVVSLLDGAIDDTWRAIIMPRRVG